MEVSPYRGSTIKLCWEAMGFGVMCEGSPYSGDTRGDGTGGEDVFDMGGGGG